MHRNCNVFVVCYPSVAKFHVPAGSSSPQVFVHSATTSAGASTKQVFASLMTLVGAIRLGCTSFMMPGTSGNVYPVAFRKTGCVQTERGRYLTGQCCMWDENLNVCAPSDNPNDCPRLCMISYLMRSFSFCVCAWMKSPRSKRVLPISNPSSRTSTHVPTN